MLSIASQGKKVLILNCMMVGATDFQAAFFFFDLFVFVCVFILFCFFLRPVACPC